jgi:hypothetical protein
MQSLALPTLLKTLIQSIRMVVSQTVVKPECLATPLFNQIPWNQPLEAAKSCPFLQIDGLLEVSELIQMNM